jgi:two-component system response regulator YcbB
MIPVNFFIVDDSSPIRAMLANIIEEENLGKVVGEAEDGSEVYADILADLEVDFLLIDLLMPNRDGIETVKEIAPFFSGKIIMISQVESKDLVGEAYSLGIDYYITKPINRLEVVSILKRARDYLLLQKSIQQIQQSLSGLQQPTAGVPKERDENSQFGPSSRAESMFVSNPNSMAKARSKGKLGTASRAIVASGKNVLLELGIIGESGNKDFLDILSIMYQLEQDGIRETPSLKELYEKVIEKRLGHSGSPAEVKKETKAVEQRIRRTIYQALEHIAALGLTDYTNPKFEHYASTFFDYTQVRMKMLELEGKGSLNKTPIRINIKKFIQALYLEAKIGI